MQIIVTSHKTILVDTSVDILVKPYFFVKLQLDKHAVKHHRIYPLKCRCVRRGVRVELIIELLS